MKKILTLLTAVLIAMSAIAAVTGSSTENTPGQGSAFTNGYDYSFSTEGTSVTISFTEKENYSGLVAYLWNQTNGFVETQMTVSGHTASITLTDQTPGNTLTFSCKFAFSGGMSVTKQFTYTVENSTKTIYCKADQSWWTQAGATVGVFVGSNTDNKPGSQMTKVAGETNIWKAEIAYDATVVSFTRLNPAGDTFWGAKTADLTLPTDGKDMFTITSTTGQWTSANQTAAGTWSTFVPTIPATGITLDKSAATVAVTKTITLIPTITPANANAGIDIVWSTSDATKATVNNGVVTGVAIGTAVIRATLSSTIYAECTVTVEENPSPYCEADIYHQGNAAEVASHILLSAGSDGNGHTIINIKRASEEAAKLDYIKVGTTECGFSLSEGGWDEMSLTLTTSTMTKDDEGNLKFSVLWSKVNTGDTWIVNDLILEPNATCATAVEAEGDPVYALRGTFTDWKQKPLPYTHNFAETGTSEYKITKESPNGEVTWYGNNGTMTRTNCAGWNFEARKGNCKITVDQAGAYVFNLVNNNPQISVTYPAVTKQIEVTTYQYATYYNANFAYKMPEGLEGIIVKGASDHALTLETTYAEGSVVPAGEALVLHATSTLTENTTFTLVAGTTEAEPQSSNMLKGVSTDDETTTGGSVYYRLSVGEDDKVGFYWGAAEGKAFKPGANKAYLALGSTNSGAPRRFLFETTDTATAVEDVEAAEVVKFIENGQILIKKNGVIYNAMGQIVR